MERETVYFLCSGNSARSLMAEALLRHHAGDRFHAVSAGLVPGRVHPMTLRVLMERAVDTTGLRSKSTREYLGKVSVHYAVIVCEKAAENCPKLYPFALKNLYWPFEDPAAFEGSEAEQLEKFRDVCGQVDARIRAWLAGLGEQPAEGPKACTLRG